jgi:hypothetical protein
MSRLLRFLDIQLTDCGGAVSLMRRPPFAPRKIPDTHLNQLQAQNGAGWIRSLEKAINVIQN